VTDSWLRGAGSVGDSEGEGAGFEWLLSRCLLNLGLSPGRARDPPLMEDCSYKSLSLPPPLGEEGETVKKNTLRDRRCGGPQAGVKRASAFAAPALTRRA